MRFVDDIKTKPSLSVIIYIQGLVTMARTFKRFQCFCLLLLLPLNILVFIWMRQKNLFLVPIRDVSPKIDQYDSTTRPTVVESKIIRAAVVLSLAKHTEHIAEFHLLHESWRYIQTFSPLSEMVLVDILVFCEQPSCYQIPSSCLPLKYATVSRSIALCYYEVLDPKIVEKWNSYLYMTSIEFMLTREYQRVIHKYDWVLRVDQDAVLSPGLFLGLLKKHRLTLFNMQFGGIGHGEEFTHKRLENIAKKLGYRHGGYHDLCSTWLVKPKDSIILANMTSIIAKHFIAHEFGKKVQGLINQIFLINIESTRRCFLGIQDLPDIGEWPKWWRGVTSLYAAEIAINDFYYGKLGHQHESGALDHPSYSDATVWDAWSIHCLHNAETFAKFRHRDELRAFVELSKQDRISNLPNFTFTRTVLQKVQDEFTTLKGKNWNAKGSDRKSVV